MNRPQDLKDVIALILSQLPRAKKATGKGIIPFRWLFYYMS
ncbi:hypothetical protein PAECIP111890_01237 [Paenibacillus sp. JJ-223]|nr:hypothetical protein PAECIP111890_01237 [Paenibacillus sp. JJ-223]